MYEDMRNEATNPDRIKVAPKRLESYALKPYGDTKLLMMAPMHVYTPYIFI